MQIARSTRAVRECLLQLHARFGQFELSTDAFAEAHFGDVVAPLCLLGGADAGLPRGFRFHELRHGETRIERRAFLGLTQALTRLDHTGFGGLDLTAHASTGEERIGKPDADGPIREEIAEARGQDVLRIGESLIRGGRRQ